MTNVPRRIYWRVMIGTFCLSVFLFIVSMVFGWHQAKAERNKLCLVLHAAIDRGEFGNRPRTEGRLLRELPCHSEAERSKR